MASEKDGEETKAAPSKILDDSIVETDHVLRLGDTEIEYSARTGLIVMRAETEEEGEKDKATLFFVAYTRKDSNLSQRPITFSFNGGPGSSSVWLHLGVLGPRRVDMGDAGNLLPPPYRLVDNEFSLLAYSDLVFIDPVGTGLSRPVPGEKEDQFLDFKKDIELVGDFIRLFATRFRRWASPKFLIGESYGTTRAAGLAGYLQERHGMFLNGVILVSSILDFQTARFTDGNDLPYFLFLPTYAATAWYHQRLDAKYQDMSLEDFLEEVVQFALGEYAAGLIQGDNLAQDQRARLVEQLANFTGLSKDYLDNTDLRINIMRFIKELRREDKLTIGRLDTRFTGVDRDSAGESSEFDPSYAAIQGPYSTTFNDYLRSQLEFESDLPYEILSMKVNTKWSYQDHQNEFVNVAETLRKAITTNPHLKVLVANGYFDLATPFQATRHTFSHLGLPPSLRGNISMTYYPAGHMMYVHADSLAALSADLGDFIESCT
jgi:carboxypeptidase C (cathepsin A)